MNKINNKISYIHQYLMMLDVSNESGLLPSQIKCLIEESYRALEDPASDITPRTLFGVIDYNIT